MVETTTKGNNSWRRKLIPLIYVAPACLFMLCFIGIPVVFSVVMGFFYIPALGTDWSFIGFQNFSYVLQEQDMLFSFLRTLGFGAFSLVTTLVLGLLLAMLVAGSKHLNFYRYIFYVPGVVSSVTMGMLWNQMLNATEFGILNTVLRQLGIMQQPFQWLNSEQYTWMIVLAIGLIGCGGGMTLILFTTAINEVSAEVKESAVVEGANVWQLNTRIILPLIRPTLFSWMILSIIGSLKSFEFIYALTSGGPANTTTTLAILLFANDKGTIYGYGYSSALGVFMSIIVLAFTGVYWWLGDRKSSEV